MARQNGKVVGRIGLLENKPYNKYHDTRKANFYLFDVVDDQEVASALFDMLLTGVGNATWIPWLARRG